MENKGVINKEKSFTERVMLTGEIAEIKDKHTLAFSLEMETYHI